VPFIEIRWRAAGSGTVDCYLLMSKQTQVWRKTSWLSLVPQLLLMLAVMFFIWKVFLPDDFLLASAYGAAIYLIYSFGSKAFLLKNHRRGVYLIKLHSYQDAINEFRSSYQFLNKYFWLDKYRFITMLDSSAISYREMALCNIAYSYARLNEKDAALQSYRRAMQEFPESEIAKSGIEYLVSERSLKNTGE
jgi:tetratricopeptide (TPR) repeat protein